MPCGGRKNLPVHHHSVGFILFPLTQKLGVRRAVASKRIGGG